MRICGEEAEPEMLAGQELCPDSASPRPQPRWPVCVSSSSVLAGEGFPQPPSRGGMMKAPLPVV